MSTFMQKFYISLSSAMLFAIINLPQTYSVTDSLFKEKLVDSKDCPTKFGSVIHAVVFFAITLATMGNSKARFGIKIKHSIYGTLIYYLISSPAIYSFVASILGKQYSDNNGCPTYMGILLHALVYCLALIGVMYLPEGSK